jgi:hypothetical protein
MSLKLVTAEDKQPEAPPPLPEQPVPPKRTARWIFVGVIAVLLLLGGVALTFSLYVGSQA